MPVAAVPLTFDEMVRVQVERALVGEPVTAPVWSLSLRIALPLAWRANPKRMDKQARCLQKGPAASQE